MSNKHLYDARARAFAEANELRARVTAEGFDPNADGDAVVSLNRAHDEVERLSQAIEATERNSKLDAIDAGANGAVVAPANEDREVTSEAAYRDAFINHLRSGVDTRRDARAILDARKEERANYVGDGNNSNYTIPVTTLQKLTEQLKAFGGIYNLAEKFNTSTGNPVNWPTADETAAVGELLVDGTSTVGSRTLTFGQKTLGAYIFSSKEIDLSLALAQDSQFDLEGYIVRKAGEAIARGAAQYFATGTGTAQPQGLVTGVAASGVTGAVTTGSPTPLNTPAGGLIGAPSYNNLVDLIHSVDPAYRISGRTAFVGHDFLVRQLRKLSDLQGRPIWEPSMQAGEPSTVLGYPIYVDQGLAAPASGAKSVVFGDIAAAYVIRDVAGGDMYQLNELRLPQMQVGYMALKRFDAVVQNANAAKSFTGGAA